MNQPAVNEGPTPLRQGSDDAGAVVTRSEEQLQVHVERRPYERIVFRKVLVTEVITSSVEVRREELRIERLPLDSADGEIHAVGPARENLADSKVLEIVLHAERPVVTVQTVPVELVRVSKQVITANHEVTEDVRSERIDIEHPAVEG